MTRPVKPTTASAFRAALDPDGLALEFGVRKEDGEGPEDIEVELSDRIEMTPAAARHLAISLDEALQRLRTTYIEAPDPSGIVTDRVTPRGRTPVHARQDPAAETAATMMELVAALGVPYQYERSFRLAPLELQANRFLLTVNRADLGEAALEQCLEIGRALGMPVGFQRELGSPLAEAACIHFGFEGTPAGVVVKMYLERRVPDEERVSAVARDEPVPLHLAFKWMPDGDLRVATRYFWYPDAPIASIRDRVIEIFGANAEAPACRLALHALELAASRSDANRIQYLEVLEDENERRSFDLNVYEASLQVKDLQPALNEARDYFDVQRGRFQAVYDQVRLHPLGHVAGGTHRDGKEFLNIYHGVTSFPRFNAELG